MNAAWALNHAKYRNFVRRLMALIRQQRLDLVRVTLQGSPMALDVSSSDNDGQVAELIAHASYASLVVHDGRHDFSGQFTIDRDRPPHQAIIDFTDAAKCQRIAQRVMSEFAGEQPALETG